MSIIKQMTMEPKLLTRTALIAFLDDISTLKERNEFRTVSLAVNPLTINRMKSDPDWCIGYEKIFLINLENPAETMTIEIESNQVNTPEHGRIKAFLVTFSYQNSDEVKTPETESPLRKLI